MLLGVNNQPRYQPDVLEMQELYRPGADDYRHMDYEGPTDDVSN